MVELQVLAAGQRVDEWHPIAHLRIDGDAVEIDDELHVVDLTMPLVSLRARTRIRFEDDHEEWARSLPTAYRSGDITVRVLHDDNPVGERELAENPEIERNTVRLRDRLGQRV